MNYSLKKTLLFFQTSVIPSNASNDHSDFVWKVLVSETLVSVYMAQFGMEREEAERRMAGTPMEGEEDDDDSQGDTEGEGER